MSSQDLSSRLAGLAASIGVSPEGLTVTRCNAEAEDDDNDGHVRKTWVHMGELLETIEGLGHGHAPPKTVKDFEAYAVGIVSASVCTLLPLEAATVRMNAEHPTGIDSAWSHSEDETFSTGQSNPCACDDHPATHKHYLFTC